ALRADVRAEWDDDLSRLEAGATFPGVEFYAAYLESGRPSLFDHLPAQVVVLDFEPQRQLADARSITEDTTMLAAAEAENGELPARFELPAVELSRLELDPARPAIEMSAGELFGRVRRPSPRRGSSTRARAEELTREFTLEFAPGELVVHVDHGIARFGGMRLIDTDGVHREYLELEYAEADRLFVPVENL